MQLSRSFAAGAVGLFSLVAMSFPALASADLFDYQYCVNYGYPNSGDCQSQGYSYHTQPYIYPAGSTQNGAYLGGYNQQQYYPQQNYGYGYQQYQQPSYYYPQQQYPQQQYSYSNYNYPQTYYQPSYYSYVVPNVQLYNGYYAGGYGMGGYYR